MNFTIKVPRPSLGKSNLQQQQDWKKKLTTEVEKLQKQYPEAKLSVWSQDEHRIGLNPILRRISVETGQQLLGSVNWKRESLWLYAFVEPETGQTYWWILPRVRTDLFSAVLQDFAKHFEIGAKKRVILVSELLEKDRVK